MTYRAVRMPEGVVATVDGEALCLRLDLVPYSETFDYGESTNGASQLALAILARHLGDRPIFGSVMRGDQHAIASSMQFKWAFIVEAPKDQPFEVTSEQIDEWLAKRGVEVSR